MKIEIVKNIPPSFFCNVHIYILGLYFLDVDIWDIYYFYIWIEKEL